MDIATIALLVSGLAASVNGDVGFSDHSESVPYLKVTPSADMQERSFALSEEPDAFKHIDLKSERTFDADVLSYLVVKSEMSDKLKIEMLRMFRESFMSEHKSTEFLVELAKILAQYPQEKPEL